MNFSKLFLLGVILITTLPSVCFGQSHELADNYWTQAQSLKKQNKYLKATQLYEKSAQEEKSNPNPRQVRLAEIFNKTAYCYYVLGLYEKAIVNYDQALEIDQKLGRDAKASNHLSFIGLIYTYRGHYEKAIDFHKQALKIARKLKQEDKIALFMNNIGGVYYSWGRHKEAIEYYKQALEIDRKLNKEADYARVLNNIGQVYDSWGQFDKALEHYKQALELDRKLGKDAEIATRLNNIGGVYKKWGQYDKAIEHYQQALALDRKLSREAKSAIRLNNIGSVYESWGQYDKAIEHYRQALDFFRKSGQEASEATLLNNIGQVYTSWEQYDKALEYYWQALALDRKLGRENKIALDLNNIGVLFLDIGQYELALEYCQEALEIDRKLQMEADVARDLNNIGLVYDWWGGQYDKAIEHYRQALDFFRKSGQEESVATLLHNIGMVYDAWGQYDKAIENYKNSISILEKIRKTATGDIRRDYLAKVISTYQALASAYLKKNDPHGVLDSIEQSRARSLAEKIAGIDSELSIPTLDEVQKGLADDEAILLFSNIDHDNFILMVITDTAIDMHEISKDSFLVKSQKRYKKHILMLIEKQRGSLIKLDKKESKSITEDKKQQSDFEVAIHYYRKLLTQPRYQKDANKIGMLLYELLIEPAQNKLGEKTRVTVVPDGILGFIPFESLLDKNNKYLAQEYTLRYTQSLTINKLLVGRDYSDNKDKKPLLAMGGAVYDEISYETEMVTNTQQLAHLQKETDQAIEEQRSVRNSYARLGMGKWSNLPGTLEEVSQLSVIIKDGDTLIGDKVTENTIKQYSADGKLADYKILHFATHGLVVPEMPELSAIVLSQFKEEHDEEDGYLCMGEIAKLDLAADFVNLSACETGLGKIYGGEGVVGLTQSFLVAGANGLSVSLWQVADESTSKFMTEFYKTIQNSGKGYSQALTEVKRGFINGDYGKKWQAPYYWSPFVYYGK